jgi:hypothetical protein
MRFVRCDAVQEVRSRLDKQPGTSHFTGAASNSHHLEHTLSDLPDTQAPMCIMSVASHDGPNETGSPHSETTDFMSVISGSHSATPSKTEACNNPFQGAVNPFSLGLVNPSLGAVNPLFNETMSSGGTPTCGGIPLLGSATQPAATSPRPGSATAGHGGDTTAHNGPGSTPQGALLSLGASQNDKEDS